MNAKLDERKEIEVHPDAAIYPMLPDDEMEVLAADIKINGLRYPIVLDKHGLLIDGRNRLRACEIADVLPVFVEHAGDSVDFIESANLNRRHMTSGQRAMARAMHRPDAKRGPQELSQKNDNSLHERNLVSKARKVLRHSRDAAETVLSGAVRLETAYSEIVSTERANAATKARLEKVQTEAPDIASLVVEERMTIEDAERLIAAKRREESEAAEAERMKRVIAYRSLAPAIGLAAVVNDDDQANYLRELIEAHRDEFEGETGRTVDQLNAAMAHLGELQWTR